MKKSELKNHFNYEEVRDILGIALGYMEAILLLEEYKKDTFTKKERLEQFKMHIKNKYDIWL